MGSDYDISIRRGTASQSRQQRRMEFVGQSLDSGLNRLSSNRNSTNMLQLNPASRPTLPEAITDPLPISKRFGDQFTETKGVNELFFSNYNRNIERFSYHVDKSRSSIDETNALVEYFKNMKASLDRYLMLVRRANFSGSSTEKYPAVAESKEFPSLVQLVAEWNRSYQKYMHYLSDREDTMLKMLKQLQTFEEENILLKDIMEKHGRTANENTMLVLRDYQQRLIKYRNALRSEQFASQQLIASQTQLKIKWADQAIQTVYCDIDEASAIVEKHRYHQSITFKESLTQTDVALTTSGTTTGTASLVSKQLATAAQTELQPGNQAISEPCKAIETSKSPETAIISMEKLLGVIDEPSKLVIIEQIKQHWPMLSVAIKLPCNNDTSTVAVQSSIPGAPSVKYDPDDEIAKMTHAELVRAVKDRNGELLEIRQQFIQDRQKLEELKQEYEEYRSVRESEYKQMALENQSFRKERYALRDELSNLKTERGELLEELDVTKADLAAKDERLQLANTELAHLRNSTNDAPRELETAKEEHKQQLAAYESRLENTEASKQKLQGNLEALKTRLRQTQSEVERLLCVIGDRDKTIRELQATSDSLRCDLEVLIGNTDLNERLLRGEQDPRGAPIDEMELLHRNIVANNIRIRLLEETNTDTRQRILSASVARDKVQGFKPMMSGRAKRLAKTPQTIGGILEASQAVLRAYELHHQTPQALGPDFQKVEQVSANQTPLWHPHLQNFSPISGSRPQTARTVDTTIQPVVIEQVEVEWPGEKSVYN